MNSNLSFQIPNSKLPRGWHWVKLGEVCKINPPRPKNFVRSPDAPTTFVPMAAVDEKTGTILTPEVFPYSKVFKGYTYFEENDVLFAKITPCMQNGKHVIARNLIDGIGFGTTEFHVLRPNNEILSEWIYYFIRQPYFLHEATAYFTGAVGQQRVPDSFLSNYIIPLPAIEEQKRVATKIHELMQEVERARTACEKELEAANTLPAAYLREVFESEESRKWERKRLGEVCEIISKGTTPTTYGHSFVSSGVPFLRAEDITGGPVDFSSVTFYITKKTHDFLARSKLYPGDLLVTIAGTLGRVGYVPDAAPEANCNQAVAFARVDPTKAYVKFLCYVLQVQEILAPFIELKAGGTIQNLNLDQVRRIKIPLPDLSTQWHIVDELKEKMAQVENLQSAIRNQLSALNTLPQAILRQAFNGEL